MCILLWAPGFSGKHCSPFPVARKVLLVPSTLAVSHLFDSRTSESVPSSPCLWDLCFPMGKGVMYLVGQVQEACDLSSRMVR